MRRAPAFVAVFATLWIVRSSIGQQLVELAYSYRHGEDGAGGVAEVQFDARTGEIVGQRVLFEEPNCKKPKKLRRSSNRQLFVLSNESKNGPHVFLIRRSGHLHPQITPITLGRDKPDELRIAGPYALVTCDDDFLYRVDLRHGTVNGTLDAAKMLRPPGNAPQDIFVLPDGRHAVVAFQKDSRLGKKFGSRLAIFRLPEMELIADIRLPRLYEELHIQGNRKEQGPSPEIVYVSEGTNTLLATLDLYGAVALMDWDAAKEGNLSNWKYLPTSLDGKFGTAFPDRAMPLPGGSQVLVCNAGKDGGAVLVDLRMRQIVWKMETPPGLETPVYLESLDMAYAACPGKTKQRDHELGIVEKDYDAHAAVYAIDFKNTDEQQESVRAIPLELETYCLTRLAGFSDFLLLAVGNGPPTQLLTFDPRTEKVVDVKPAKGEIEQFESD